MTPSSAQAACERCGSFSEERQPLGSRRLCPACVAHLATSTRTWSSRYVTLLGALLNPTPAAVLLALNWQRLGDARRARQLWFTAAILGSAYLAFMCSSLELPAAALIGVGVGLGTTLGRSYQDPSARLRQAGACSANRLLPVVVSVAVVVAVALLMVVLSNEDGVFE
jgi:hypothetical protein